MRLISRIMLVMFASMLLLAVVSDSHGSPGRPQETAPSLQDASAAADDETGAIDAFRNQNRMWLGGVIIPSFAVFFLILVLFQRSRNEGKQIKNTPGRFDITWKNAESGLILIDAETRVILDANPVAAGMFGKSREKMIGNRCDELLCLGEDHRTVGQASGDKAVFLANMSHEMRTPLNVVVGLTDLMMEERTPPEIKENLIKINAAGNTLMSIISDVMDISKIETGRFDLAPVKYDVAGMLNDIAAINITGTENRGIAFNMDITEDLPCSLYGDDLRVKQVLNNILSNAFKYTKVGTVTLGMSCAREGDEDVWMSVYVSDTGIGIREADIKKLFIDYNQVDIRANRMIEGTGLGLSITKKLVELMDGEINVESEYGKGTTFRLRIRQRYAGDKKIGPETAENLRDFSYMDKKKRMHEKLVRPNLSYIRVLVVDDFRTNLDVAASMLRKYKMKVDCVTSGQDAIDLMERGKPVYNAIFMDHIMPEMDGIEATARIRALGTEYAETIPIIALTANAVAGNRQMFLNNGFQEFLPKPVNIMNFDSVIQKWIRDKSRE